MSEKNSVMWGDVAHCMGRALYMVTRLLIRTVQNVDWGRPRPWAPADLLGTAPADLLRFFAPRDAPSFP